MPVKPPRRLLILNILDILRRYTDENHRLSQREIADILGSGSAPTPRQSPAACWI